MAGYGERACHPSRKGGGYAVPPKNERPLPPRLATGKAWEDPRTQRRATILPPPMTTGRLSSPTTPEGSSSPMTLGGSTSSKKVWWLPAGVGAIAAVAPTAPEGPEAGLSGGRGLQPASAVAPLIVLATSLAPHPCIRPLQIVICKTSLPDQRTGVLHADRFRSVRCQVCGISLPTRQPVWPRPHAERQQSHYQWFALHQHPPTCVWWPALRAM